MARYIWVKRGDVNAFFGLMLDNVAVMIILFTLITSTDPIEKQSREGMIRFTPEFVLTRMIPGTALGVLFGDLIYTWMAFRLARRSGRTDVTAMPLGLDTPSTFGSTFLVLLPSLQIGYKLHGDHQTAMEYAWHVGLVTLTLCGIFKIFCAPFGNAIRSLVPKAGLFGSLAAIALALIAFLPMLLDGIAGVPLVGMIALLVILLTLVAHLELPGRFPGALAAVLIGVLIHFFGRGLEAWFGIPISPDLEKISHSGQWQPLAMIAFGSHDSIWWQNVVWASVSLLPVALPFALATVVGGIDCTESAAAAGDEYDTRSILLTEGTASLLAGLLGGVIQTTPYIGHPAYKKMGARAGYTLATALFIGFAGYFGVFQYLFEWLPRGAMFPILVFVGLEITAQAFFATPPRHYPAIAFAMLPALAYLVLLVVKNLHPGAVPERPDAIVTLQTLRCLANGFLISGLLWAAALAMILDRRLRSAAGFFALAGVFTFFGIIHSPLSDERLGFPWQILAAVEPAFQEAVQYQTPYHWAASYVVIALILMILAPRIANVSHDNPDDEARSVPSTGYSSDLGDNN